MRTREIKPGFFKNEDLGEINPLGRLLFIGMWLVADREGRLEDRPKKLRAEILPYDNCDGEELVSELERRGFIIRYEVDGCRYIQINNWDKHQNPHVKEAKSTIPAPPGVEETKDISCESTGNSGASTVQEPDKNSEFPPALSSLSSLSLNLNTGGNARACAMDDQENVKLIAETYQQYYGRMAPTWAISMLEYCDQGMSPEVVAEALKLSASASNPRSYCKSILDRCLAEKVLTLERFLANQADFEARKLKAIGGTQNVRGHPGRCRTPTKLATDEDFARQGPL